MVPHLSAPISALQAYNLGLPTLYQQGFGDSLLITWQPRINLFAQDSFTNRPGLTVNYGIRYEYEENPTPVNTDTNNFAPRLSFAWNPRAHGKTVIRGGYGIFYSQINSHTNNLPINLDGVKIAQAFLTIRGIPGVNNPRTGQPLTAADVYQTLLAQGVIGRRSITREDIAQFGLRPGPNAAGRVIFGIVPEFINPYSQQASLEIERAFGTTAVSLSYTLNRGAHIVRNLDRNLYYGPRRADGQPTFLFRDPAILQYNVLESTANSFYHAFILQATRRFQRRLSFHAHYTLSKAIDEVTDFNRDWQPHDQLNARAERSLSPWDQRHRGVVNMVVESPWTAGRGKGLRDNLLGNFLFSAILSANSARPFNILAGFDNLGDNHPNTHRPLGAGRNIGRGPAYASLDLRATRRFPLDDDARKALVLTAEAFNVLNHTNFKTVNNTVGNARLEDLPRPIAGRTGAPTMPLSFTSAFPSRQLQLGARLVF